MQNNEYLFVPTEPVETKEQVTPQDPITENIVEDTPKKSKSKFWPVFGIVSGAVVLTGVIIAIITACLSGNKYIEQETDIIAFNTGFDEVIVCEDGERIDTRIPGKRSSYISSIKGDASLLAATKNTDDENSPKTLYYIHDEDITKIIDDVKGYRLSAEGNAALYVAGASALSKTDFNRNETTYITDNVGDYEISPNGSAAAYTVPGYGYTSVYYFDGKESILIDDNFPANSTVLGLSDKGNYIYIKGNSDDVAGPLYRYTRKNNKYVKLCDNFQYLICFNYNNTQILYTETDGATYFAEKNKDVKQISTITVTPCISSRTGSRDRTYGIKNLCDGFYSSKEADDMCKLHYVDREGNITALTENAIESVAASYDGDTAYFLTSEKNLYKIKAKSYAKGTQIAQNVDFYIVSTESDQLYFLIEGNLHFGFSEFFSKEVMKEVDHIAVLDDGICIFSSSTGSFKCRNGKDIVKMDDDKLDFFSYGNSVFYYKKTSSDMYELYGFDGEEYFELIGSSSRFY